MPGCRVSDKWEEDKWKEEEMGCWHLSLPTIYLAIYLCICLYVYLSNLSFKTFS